MLGCLVLFFAVIAILLHMFVFGWILIAIEAPLFVWLCYGVAVLFVFVTKLLTALVEQND